MEGPFERILIIVCYLTKLPRPEKRLSHWYLE